MSSGEDVFECSKGWFSNGHDKCIFLVDAEATYYESKAYCNKKFGANLLSISTEEQRLFYVIYLFKISNISESVWLETTEELEQNGNCRIIFKSKSNKHSGRVGKIQLAIQYAIILL